MTDDKTTEVASEAAPAESDTQAQAEADKSQPAATEQAPDAKSSALACKVHQFVIIETPEGRIFECEICRKRQAITEKEPPADPEAQERDAIWDMIVDRYAVEDWEAALLTLNMAKTKPPTVDGCLALLDHLKDNFERLA
jgi:hypothetical protein